MTAEPTKTWGQSYQTPPPRRPVLAWLILLLHRIIGLLPLWAVHLIATALSGAASFLPTRERHVSEINLGIAFPDLDKAARRRLAASSTVNTASRSQPASASARATGTAPWP